LGVSRIDLGDIGSPEGLVAKILKDEPGLTLPVPIEDLCYQLEIQAIAPLQTDGFEGGLITDMERSSGIILFNTASGEKRRRFTLGHELGHFLLLSHVPNFEGRFLCSRADFSRLTTKEGDRRSKMEVEANRFSSLILMPPPFVRKEMNSKNHPSIEHMFEMADIFSVSKQAMARTYAEYSIEAIAFVLVQDGKVIGAYRNRAFPFLQATKGRAVPARSRFHTVNRGLGRASDIDGCIPDIWIDVERGKAAPQMSEQVVHQANNVSTIMLWYEAVEDDEENDERTAKQRWKDRQSPAHGR
jgi:hypothetical protein